MSHLLPFSLLLVLGVAACGGRVGADEPSDNARPSDGGGVSVGADAAVSDIEQTPATKQGTVSLFTLPANLIGSATFRDGAPEPMAEGCRIDAIRASDTPRGDRAGDVRLSYVAKRTGRSARLVPWDSKTLSYSFVEYGSDLSRLDVAGESVDVSVSGGIVPAFGASVVASADFEVRGARAGEGLNQDLDAASETDLVLAWSNAENPIMDFDVHDEAKFVRCRFPAPATSGVVPKAFMRQLSGLPGSGCPEGASCLSARLAGMNETHVRAGAYDVTLQHATWRLLRLVIHP